MWTALGEEAEVGCDVDVDVDVKRGSMAATTGAPSAPAAPSAPSAPAAEISFFA